VVGAGIIDVLAAAEVKIFRLDLEDRVPGIELERAGRGAAVGIGHAGWPPLYEVFGEAGQDNSQSRSTGHPQRTRLGGNVGAVQRHRDAVGVDSGDRGTGRERQLVGRPAEACSE